MRGRRPDAEQDVTGAHAGMDAHCPDPPVCRCTHLGHSVAFEVEDVPERLFGAYLIVQRYGGQQYTLSWRHEVRVMPDRRGDCGRRARLGSHAEMAKDGAGALDI